MPSYRGIDQAALLKSIHDGLALLESYPTGSECLAKVGEARLKLDAITNAKNDKELTLALAGTRTSYLFNRLGDVMAHHALLNTDGIGRSIYDALSSWGAFSGAMTMEYNKLDYEQQHWLCFQYADHLAEKTATLSLKEIFDGVAVPLATDQTAQGQRLMKKAVKLVQEDPSGEAFADFFDKLTLNERYTMETVGTAATGMTRGKLAEKSPMISFGLVIDDLTTGKKNWMDPEIKTIRDFVEKVISPFWGLDEVDMVGVGIINIFQKPEHQGIVIGGTRRVAEALAKAMPGHKVMDSDGNIITAPTPKKISPPKP